MPARKTQRQLHSGSWAWCLIPSMYIVGLLSFLVALTPLLIDDPSPCVGVGDGGHWSGSGVLVFVVGTVGYVLLAGLSLGSWLRTTLTDPGCPPASREQLSPALHPLRDRYPLCRRCRLVKIPRTHHCSICKRCVVRYDHHCPWVNNCVGLRNHKYFYLFTLWGTVLCLFIVAVLLARYAVVGWKFCYVDIGVVPVLLLAVFGGFFTATMCGNHTYLLLRGGTTLEHSRSFVRPSMTPPAPPADNDHAQPSESTPVTSPSPRRHIPFDYYSHSWRRNCASVLGDSLFCMLCPVGTAQLSDRFEHPAYEEELEI